MGNIVSNFGLQAAATSGNGAAAFLGGKGLETVVWLFFIGTVTGGSVTVEEAPTSDYTGTWSTIAVVPAESNKVIPVRFSGPVHALRARIDTEITGGAKLTATVDTVG